MRQRIDDALRDVPSFNYVDGEIQVAPNVNVPDLLQSHIVLIAALIDITADLAAEIDRLRSHDDS